MKKIPKLDFTKKPRKKRPAVTVSIIVAGVLLLGAVTFIILLALNDFDTAKFLGTRQEITSAPTENESAQAETSEKNTAPEFSDGDAQNFLFICHNGKELSFCTVLSASVKENSIKIKAVDPLLTCETDSDRQTVSEIFSLKGAPGVKQALDLRGIIISRYVAVNETNFKIILSKLGQTFITVEKDISFSVGSVTYSFSAGKNEMGADMLLKYMKYADEGDALLNIQAKAGAELTKQKFTSQYYNKGEELFSQFINLVDSDITAFDYTEYSAELLSFINAEPSVVAVG